MELAKFEKEYLLEIIGNEKNLELEEIKELEKFSKLEILKIIDKEIKFFKGDKGFEEDFGENLKNLRIYILQYNFP